MYFKIKLIFEFSRPRILNVITFITSRLVALFYLSCETET